VPEQATIQAGPGRPSTGADERILEAALEVLERDGYSGLTTAKVAERSGHNKALIAYHFGSKQGLVSEVTRRVAAQFSRELLAEVGQPRTAEELARALVEAVWSYIDRHGGQARIYFDLASQSLVDRGIKEIVDEIKQGHLALLSDLLGELDNPPDPRDREAAIIFLVAALEGLALERLDRGAGDEQVESACEMFVRSAATVLG
jgi:AcrR family transcriptional regulator